MTSKEKQLFQQLCTFKADKFDETLLEYATPNVLGQLFFNRMQAIAYGTLKKHKLLGKVNREFRNSLKYAYEHNVTQNQNYHRGIQHILPFLSACGCKYAMLKGAFLFRYYPEGYRTSNDIDLLVDPDDVTKIGKTLTNFSFQQGHIRNDEFVPATRREIIESKMMRGETVPYIKKMGPMCPQYLEVDLNFSLDYKNGDPFIVRDLLDRSCCRNVSGLEIPTLEACDFFIHLCSHLYKEATTLPWVEMKRDMTLYKYCDIYMLLSDFTETDVEKVFKRAKELDMEKICAFAILQTAELFGISNLFAYSLAQSVLVNDPDFIHTVISPQEKKRFIYKEKDIYERFFAENRKELLEEVTI